MTLWCLLERWKRFGKSEIKRGVVRTGAVLADVSIFLPYFFLVLFGSVTALDTSSGFIWLVHPPGSFFFGKRSDMSIDGKWKTLCMGHDLGSPFHTST